MAGSSLLPSAVNALYQPLAVDEDHSQVDLSDESDSLPLRGVRRRAPVGPLSQHGSSPACWAALVVLLVITVLLSVIVGALTAPWLCSVTPLAPLCPLPRAEPVSAVNPFSSVQRSIDGTVGAPLDPSNVVVVTADTSLNDAHTCHSIASAVRLGYNVTLVQLPDFAGDKDKGLLMKPMAVLQLLEAEERERGGEKGNATTAVSGSTVSASASERLYMFVDARDTIFQRSPATLRRLWQAAGAPSMLISSEANSWPPEMVARYPKFDIRDEPSRVGYYANSGQYLFTLQGGLAFLRKYRSELDKHYCDGQNDQCYFGHILLDSNFTLAQLDRTMSIMLSMHPDGGLPEHRVKDPWTCFGYDELGRLHRTDGYHGTPVSVHYNGPSKDLTFPLKWPRPWRFDGLQLAFYRNRQWSRTDIPDLTESAFMSQVRLLDKDKRYVSAAELAKTCVDFQPENIGRGT